VRADGLPIFVGQDGSSARLEQVELEPRGAGTFDELWLQHLIHAHPDALPLEQIEPRFGRPVAICMELPTRHGPIDNLLMTGDGDIVIVETKLWRNVEARRKVVAQTLDYAACLFEMDYSDFQAAALKGNFGDRPRPEVLHEALGEGDVLDEPRFIDAVNSNLHHGRIVLLVVGDGIRSEVERLAAMLQSHAGAHFTFALVELAVFRLPVEGGFLVAPRTLAKTQMIERGIVRVDDQRVRVDLVRPDSKAVTVAPSISAEQFFDDMRAIRKDIPDKLKGFLAGIARFDVYPDFRKSLVIRWNSPNGTPVTLGCIYRDGQVWTDGVNLAVPLDLAHRYNEKLAEAVGVDVERTIMQPSWHIRRAGKVPRIDSIADRLDAWATVIEWFVLEAGKSRERDAPISSP